MSIQTAASPSLRHNPEYPLMAALYAAAFGSIALVFPYLTPYLLGIGFSGADVGNVNAIGSLLLLLTTPLFSALADRTGRHRRLLAVSLVIGNGALVGIALRPSLLTVAVLLVLNTLAGSVAMTLRDRLALFWLKQQGSVAFGALRLWGSLGFSVIALLGGLVADRVGVEPLLMVSAAINILSLALLRPLPQRLPVQPAASDSVGRRLALPAVMWAVLLTTLVIALARTAYYGWSLDFIQNDLGGGRSAAAQYTAITALFEIPLMVFADRLIRRWGAAAMWGASLLLLAASWAGLSLAQTPLQALLLAVPLGIAQAFFFVAPVVLVGQVSAPHRVAFHLALTNVVTGLGTTLGNPVAGRLFDALGVRPLLQIGAVSLVIAALTIALSGRAYAAARAPERPAAG